MEHLSADSIYNEIMLLPNADRQKLYSRLQKEFQEDDKFVAYTTSGKPLTRSQYIEKINKAIAEADRGELLTTEDLQKVVETW